MKRFILIMVSVGNRVCANMTKEETTKAIAEKITQVQALLTECAALADAVEIPFKFYPVDGADYGLYRDPGYKDEDYVEEARWRPINEDGWVPSSLDC